MFTVVAHLERLEGSGRARREVQENLVGRDLASDLRGDADRLTGLRDLDVSDAADRRRRLRDLGVREQKLASILDKSAQPRDVDPAVPDVLVDAPRELALGEDFSRIQADRHREHLVVRLDLDAKDLPVEPLVDQSTHVREVACA